VSFLRDADSAETAFAHPGCGGQFRVKGVGFSSLKRDPRRYSVDGLRLKALANASQKPDA
jgi:hypothetical protein